MFWNSDILRGSLFQENWVSFENWRNNPNVFSQKVLNLQSLHKELYVGLLVLFITFRIEML